APELPLFPYADCSRCPLGSSSPWWGGAGAVFARRAIKEQSTGPVAAVIIEPMQGTAGNVIPPPEFLPAIAEAAREAGALLIVDEMITGFGRTGRVWGVDHSNTRPDIMTVGKWLGSGVPISGVLASTEVSQAKPWSNPSGSSSSYGGNPLAAAAALASVRTIREEELWKNAGAVGQFMLSELRAMQERFEFIGDVRGLGLL